MLKIAWNELYCHSLPTGHRFPMIKYNLIPEQLIYEGTINDENLFSPILIQEQDILSSHTREYWEKLKNGTLSKREERNTGFPYSEELVMRERTIVQGSIDCSLFALQNRISINVAGGTHHAYSYKGEGFCLLNDIAIAANYLLNHTEIQKILVVDLDVHQGDGTAEIFNNDHRVFTFSMHGEKNFPLKKQKSDLDVPLKDHADDKEYLDLLDWNLKSVIQSFQPEFIFYQAGVDILKNDKLGRLDVSPVGCKERDRMVISTCHENNIPIMINMGGGYSHSIRDIVEAHANTFRLSQEIFF
mgnify:CR=1 FL=1